MICRFGEENAYLFDQIDTDRDGLISKHEWDKVSLLLSLSLILSLLLILSGSLSNLSLLQALICLVVMMNSKELKTKICSHAHSLILCMKETQNLKFCSRADSLSFSLCGSLALCVVHMTHATL